MIKIILFVSFFAIAILNDNQKAVASQKYAKLQTARFDIVVKKGREKLAINLTNFGEQCYADFSDILICDLENPIILVPSDKKLNPFLFFKKNIVYYNDLHEIEQIYMDLSIQFSNIFIIKMKSEDRYTVEAIEKLEKTLKKYINIDKQSIKNSSMLRKGV